MVGTLGNGLGVYTVSKFAVVAYSEALRQELEPEGIGVSVLCPGGVRTRIFEATRNRPAELGGAAPTNEESRNRNASNGMDPLDVGRLVVNAVKANRPYIFTHQENRPQVAERFEGILEAFNYAL
jgi:short-subunit dehydrogenase